VGILQRLSWHLNRTPAAHVLKAVHRAWKQREIAERRALSSTLMPDPQLSARARELKAEGYVDLTDVAPQQSLLELAAAAGAKVARAAELAGRQALTHKAFWVRLLDEDAPSGCFPSDNVFVRFAMHPRLVSLVAAFLGELPKLTDVILTLSRPANGDLAFSQLWHRDYDDVHTVKVFVYLTDVLDVGDGPFTFLAGPRSDTIGFTRRSHLSDEALFRRVDRGGVREVYGRRHTVFACETSRCLHMGSRIAQGHARLMFTASYISAPNVYPGVRPRFRLVGRATPVDALVLDAPERNRH